MFTYLLSSIWERAGGRERSVEREGERSVEREMEWSVGREGERFLGREGERARGSLLPPSLSCQPEVSPNTLVSRDWGSSSSSTSRAGQ